MWLAGPLLVGSGVTYRMPGLYLHQERSTCQAPQYCLTLGPNTFPPFEKECIVLNTE